MSTNKTQNYGLHAWEAEDDFLRTEFNENFEKLDTELKKGLEGLSSALTQQKATAQSDDSALRQEFNKSLDTVNAALQALSSGKAEVAVGVYTGDGEESQFIDLGFTPQAVLVVMRDGFMGSGTTRYGGLAVTDNPAYYAQPKQTIFEIVDNGFNACYGYYTSYYAGANKKGEIYHYLALK